MDRGISNALYTQISLYRTHYICDRTCILFGRIGEKMEKTNLSKCCSTCRHNKHGNNSLFCQACHNATMQERLKAEYEKNKS